MDSVLAVRPRKAVRDDVADLTQTLAAAFFDDPFFTWWIADPERRSRILPEFFRILVQAILGHDEIYTTDDGVAGAVWVPPATQLDETQFVPALAEVSGEYAQRLFQAFGLMQEKHPHEPHWYLFFLATRPGWQSRGIGSALMRPVLESCDRKGVAAYLEASSERNRRLYLRHGFRVIDEIRLPAGPTMWCMWRASGSPGA